MLTVSMMTSFGVSAIFITMATLAGGDHVIMNPFVEEEVGAKETALIIVPERGLTADDYQMFGE